MGKGAPAGLSKDDEIARLGEELQAHELMVNEEVKARERLERENLTKIKEIRLLEQRIASNHAAQLAEIDLIETEAQTEKTRAQHDIEIMQHKLVTTTQHLEAYDEMEHENAVLRARAGACLEQLQEEGLSHAAAEHKMKKEMFNLRMQLEQTFRKTLQEKDAQYRERAFEAMSEESRMALVANAKLQEELSLQSVGVEHFMQRFKTTTEEHRKLQQQHALLSEASKLQLNTASKLKRQKLEQEALVADLQSSMRAMVTEHVAAATAEAEAAAGGHFPGAGQSSSSRRHMGAHGSSTSSAVLGSADAEEQLEQMCASNTRLKKRCEKWKGRSLALSRRAMGAQARTEAELVALQQRVSISMAEPSIGGGASLLEPSFMQGVDCMAENSVHGEPSLLVDVGRGGDSLVAGPVSASMEDIRAIWSSKHVADTAGAPTTAGSSVNGGDRGGRARQSGRRRGPLVKAGSAVTGIVSSAEIQKRYFVPG